MQFGFSETNETLSWQMVCGLSRDKSCVAVLGIQHKCPGTLCLGEFFVWVIFIFFLLQCKPCRHICIIFYNTIRGKKGASLIADTVSETG